MKSNDFDVIIIGAGAVGSATANLLAPDHDVLVLDKAEGVTEASKLASGKICLTKFYHEMPDVAKYGNEFFRGLDGTGDFTFLNRPRLEFATEEHVDSVRSKANKLAEHGFPASYITAEEIEETYPYLDPEEFKGAISYGTAGVVDTEAYCSALKNEAEAEGAQFKMNTAAENLLVKDNSVVGVETDAGNFKAKTVLSAMGWRAQEFLRDYASIPIKPFEANTLLVELNQELDSQFPQGSFVDTSISFRAEGQETEGNRTLRIGAGFGECNDPEGVSKGEVDADSDVKEFAYQEMPRILPGFEDSKIVDSFKGCWGKTPDNFPTIDTPSNGPDGLIVGHTLGVLSSPVVAKGVRSLITGEECPFSLEPFSLDRYDRGTSDWDASELPDYFSNPIR